MEKDQEKTSLLLLLPSTSSVGDDIVVNGDDVSASPVSATSTATEGEEGGAASPYKEDKKKVVFASEEQIRAVFSNNLIAHTILSHLNFADMKSARQVSQTFLEMVEGSKRFKDAQVLRVAKGKIPAAELNVILNTDRIWRGIRIDVPHIWTENSLTQNISRVLKNIEFVSFRVENSSDYKKLDMKALGCIVSFIRDLLSCTRNIKHLQIEAALFDLHLRRVFECSDVNENLKTLQRFDITDHNNCAGKHRLTTFTHSFWSSSSNPVTINFSIHCLTENFRLLGTILQRLQSFGMANGSYYIFWGGIIQLQSAVVKLLEQNRESLRELCIHSRAWDDIGVHGVTLPRLRSLSASTYFSASDRLKDFLANHQTLEELYVHVEVAFVTSLFDVIKLRSANLRKLHLKAKKFVKSVSTSGRMREVKVDWTFLGEMKRLKDFKIVRPFWKNPNCEKYGTGADLLGCLPQNQLERLSLKGIGARECGFWRSPDVMGQYIDIELTSKLELLVGFRNLNRLSLRRCPDAVDDDIMQFILNEMKSLQELELSHCSQLTDVGFGGTSEDGSDSIRNLRGLKRLSIACCPLVTPDGLLSCLRLQLLRHFEYVASVKVTKSFVLKIMSQNPSLESLAVNLDCPESEVLEELHHARLTKLKNLEGADQDFDYDSDDSLDEEIVSSESEDEFGNVIDDNVTDSD